MSAHSRASPITNWTVSSDDHISSCGPSPSILSVFCENSKYIHFYLCERKCGSGPLAWMWKSVWANRQCAGITFFPNYILASFCYLVISWDCFTLWTIKTLTLILKNVNVTGSQNYLWHWNVEGKCCVLHFRQLSCGPHELLPFVGGLCFSCFWRGLLLWGMVCSHYCSCLGLVQILPFGSLSPWPARVIGAP